MREIEKNNDGFIEESIETVNLFGETLKYLTEIIGITSIEIEKFRNFLSGLKTEDLNVVFDKLKVDKLEETLKYMDSLIIALEELGFLDVNSKKIAKALNIKRADLRETEIIDLLSDDWKLRYVLNELGYKFKI